MNVFKPIAGAPSTYTLLVSNGVICDTHISFTLRGRKYRLPRSYWKNTVLADGLLYLPEVWDRELDGLRTEGVVREEGFVKDAETLEIVKEFVRWNEDVLTGAMVEAAAKR